MGVAGHLEIGFRPQGLDRLEDRNMSVLRIRPGEQIALLHFGQHHVMTAVAAFMITVGTFASVISGATAMAFGVQTKPVRRFTLSRTMLAVPVLPSR